MTCHWRQGRFCENARGKGGFVRCHKSHRASPRVHESKRLRSLSTVFYAPRARGTRGRAESRPDGRPSRVRAITRTRPRLLFPANPSMCVARVRRTPVSTPPSTFVAPATRRILLEMVVDGRPSRGPNGGSRSARDSTSRVCHGTPISSMGFVASRAFRSIGRSSGARPRTRHRDARDARGRRSSRRPSRDSHFPRARARRARRALALVVLPSSDPGRSWRWKYPRERGAWRGFPSRARRGERSRASGTKSIALLDVDRFPRHETIASRLTPLPDFPLPPFPPSPLSPAQPQTLQASTPNRPPCPP